MSIRDDFFAAKLNGSLWDVAVSIKRGNPLPLDADSIFDSYAALEAYAADVLAYPGQVVAVVNEDSTGIYYLDQNLAIHPIGVSPSGDEKTIEVSASGAVSLLGAAAAANGTIPMIGEEGKLIWKTLEDIGAGDGNDNTTYEFDFANEKIIVTPKLNGIEQTPVELDLSTFVTAEEFAEEIGKLVDNDTTYSVAEGEKVLKLNETVFSTEIGLKHENGMISLTGINGEVIAEFSDSDFIKDSVLEDVAYDAEAKEIVFTWKTEGEETKTDKVSVADFVQTYTVGNGLEASGNEFSVKVDSTSEEFLSVSENGIKVSGVLTAIETAKQEAISDAEGKYATATALGQLETSVNGRLTTLEAIDHTLLATKAELGPIATAASNAETAVGNLESRFDEIVAVGGEPNAINKIQVNGSELIITNKTVNIEVPTTISGLEGWTALDERVTAAKAQADKGVSDASAAQAKADNNATEIATIGGRLTTLESDRTAHAGRLDALETANAQHAGEYTALKAIVDGHVTAIASKAEASAVSALELKVTANENAVKTINETTIPGVLAEVNKKANADNVYSKSEIGTITEGKTLVQMIEAVKTEASYDDTEVRGLITSESERAIAAEGALSGRLDTVETFFAAVETPDETINTLAEIVSYIESDKSGASEMAASIKSNSDAIAAINNETTGILATAQKYTDDKIAAIPVAGSLLGLVKSSEADNEVKVAEDGTMSINRVSVDKLYVSDGDELILNGGNAV
jgi:hypothetical protein